MLELVLCLLPLQGWMQDTLASQLLQYENAGCIGQLHILRQTQESASGSLTILTRSLVRMRMPLQALRASSHLEYDSLVLDNGQKMSFLKAQNMDWSSPLTCSKVLP